MGVTFHRISVGVARDTARVIVAGPTAHTEIPIPCLDDDIDEARGRQLPTGRVGGKWGVAVTNVHDAHGEREVQFNGHKDTATSQCAKRVSKEPLLQHTCRNMVEHRAGDNR